MISRALSAFAALALVLAPLVSSATSYEFYKDASVAQAAIDLWFRAPGAGYDDATPGISRLSATAAAAAKLESGSTLAEFIRRVGGRLTINVYPDLVGVSVTVPAPVARRTVAALSAAYFAPAIDDAALKTAQRDVAMLAISRKYLSDDLLHDALFAKLFESGAAHFAPLPDSVPLMARISLADVQAFARRAFRSANATMTLAGNVDESLTLAVTAGAAGTIDAPISSGTANSPTASSTLSANVTGVGLAWTGPPIADERAATAMDFVADYLFRDGTGVIPKAFVLGDTYVSGQFITLHNPGVMLVTIGGSGADAARTRVTGEIDTLTRPLDAAAFAAAREAFLYHLAADTQLPVQQADNLGWYAAEGNAAYAPSDARSTYWEVARSLDPQFVASVVRRYLTKPVVVQLNSASPKEPAS
jgi:predicted Zn-dependent peptidase